MALEKSQPREQKHEELKFAVEQKIRQRASQDRRMRHPNWPSHRPTLTIPGQPDKVWETMPTGRARVKGYCKYCHTTHANWWLMDRHDYFLPGEGKGLKMFLCGECEHTSRSDFL